MSDKDRSIQVLLVDDEENILKSLQRLLMEEEFEVHTAASAERAIAALKGLDNVGLIVSDQRMPGMNGSEFLQYCREAAPDALRILLTGYSDITATIDAINKGGAYRYVSKPWNDAELIQTIRDAVRQYALLRENHRLNEVVRQQNEELQEWNNNLRNRVLQQTTAIRQKNEELQQALDRSKSNYHGVIEILSRLVEMRGKRNNQHSKNVAQLSLLVSKELGLAAEETETIRLAALLHDIGEIGIPERILLMTPEAMNPEEFHEYSLHPVGGQLLLDNIEELRPAGVLIRHHHEQMDGKGFPDHLAGEDIPLGARIIAFADRVDRAAGFCVNDIADQAMARASLNLGTQLDPALQKAFKKAARYYYFSDPHQEGEDTLELELKPVELKPGMIMARDFFSGTGVLLLHRGVTLDEGSIQSIQRYHGLDPSESGIFVFVRR